MQELSLHILDIVENSIMAGADLVEIRLEKDEVRDRLSLGVIDNGRGITPEDLARITDPFFTTRTTRRVGLGLALLKQNAEQCQGKFGIESALGRGTTVKAEFRISHLDRPPLGDMVGTLLSLIVGRPDVHLIYRQISGEDEFLVDTREIKAVLEGVSLSDPDVIKFLRENLKKGLVELGPL